MKGFSKASPFVIALWGDGKILAGDAEKLSR